MLGKPLTLASQSMACAVPMLKLGDVLGLSILIMCQSRKWELSVK